MKYLIDLSQRQVQKIQQFLDTGQYQSPTQFIITAIENQFALEENENLTDGFEMKKPITNIHTVANPLHITRVLEAYRISDMDNLYSVLPPPKFEQIVLSTQNLPEKNTWIWGQVNKIFPVKIGLRILQKNLGRNQSIELNEFLDTAAKEAAEIGKIIREYEKKNSKERNEKISAGLPQVSDEKSQSRYKFQFLAYQRKDDLLDGAMALLKFCNLEKKNGKTFIGLTERGEKFSNEINPVLDKGDLDNSLSKQEIEFYLTHINNNVISESTAIKWLLNKINTGVNERSQLNKELVKDYGKIWNTTEAVINTQRSGLTARAFELGLLEKEKTGIYVSYKITDAGLNYLSTN